ncbi:MAG: hypothetical protein JWN24_4833 [Phycisphaerales bacterium]|nr:hypothetical protein [Phycisphaerales bacterium]
MATDQVVSPQDVLRAVMQLRRQGTASVIKELESQEPDLAEFLLEETSAVHRQLLDLGGAPGRVRRVHRRVESLALVLVLALRQARLRLWQEPSPEVQAEGDSSHQQEIGAGQDDLPPAGADLSNAGDNLP